MQVMPPMLRVIFLVLASVMCDSSLRLWLVYLGCLSIINISFKDISFNIDVVMKTLFPFSSHTKNRIDLPAISKIRNPIMLTLAWYNCVTIRQKKSPTANSWSIPFV